MTSNRPEKAKHRMDYTPTWVQHRGEEELRPLPPKLVARTDDELKALAADFVASITGDPKPTTEEVADRVRHVLACARDTQQKVIVVSRSVPPYFGVTTARTAVVVEEP